MAASRSEATVGTDGREQARKWVRGTAALVVLLLVGAVVLVVRASVDDGESVLLDAEAADLLLPGGGLIVEVDETGGSPLDLMLGLVSDEHELLATSWNGGTVGLLVLPRSKVETGRGEVFVDPREGGDSSYYSFLALPWHGASWSWLIDGDTIGVAGSLDLTSDQLRAFSAETRRDETGRVTAPGAMIGRFDTQADDELSVTFRPDAEHPLVGVYHLTAEARAALTAVSLRQPANYLNERTEASCCISAITQPERAVEVGDRAGSIATLTSDIRLLVIDGEPGVVLAVGGAQRSSNYPTDDEIVDLLNELEPVTADDVDDWVQAHS